jgi:NADH dehydrogenase
MSVPHVVILGGGFAGLDAARKLRNAPVKVTVVDRRNHHLFQPMLYQVATAALNPADIASPIRSVLSRQRNAEVVLAEATAVVPDERRLELGDGTSLEYDYLILAPGARHSYFGHDEWEPLAPGLKNLEDALEIRRRVLVAFERAERARTPEERQAHLTFVVVGGGATGVETAGALAEIRSYALRRDFRRIDSREAVVMLLEGGPRVMPTYPPELSVKTKESLRRLGVDVREDTMVTEIGDGYVRAAGWTIPTHTVVWAAGNVASPLLRTLGAPLDRQGRVKVERDCTVPGHPEIFVLGDAALYEEPARGGGKPKQLPGIAPVAMQMGRYAARTIAAEAKRAAKSGAAGAAGAAGSVADPTAREPFRYIDKGQLAVIGRGRAVADIWKLHFSGFIAWLLWIFIHIFYLIGFRNRVLVMIQWAYSYFTFQRGARIITSEGAAAGCVVRQVEEDAETAAGGGAMAHR